jgi:DNA helicase HerA-like ATPase
VIETRVAPLVAPGVAWYAGCPGSGKTTLAKVHARQWSKDTGWPVLVIDSTGASDFERILHTSEPREIVKRLWILRERVTVTTPEDDRVLDGLIRAVRGGRGVVLLVDEAHFWLSGFNRSGELLRLMRATRHAHVRLLLTTQHLSGDIPQAAFACAPDLYLFRTTSPRSLKVLEREFEVEPAKVRELPKHRFIRKRTSF